MKLVRNRADFMKLNDEDTFILNSTGIVHICILRKSVITDVHFVRKVQKKNVYNMFLCDANGLLIGRHNIASAINSGNYIMRM